MTIRQDWIWFWYNDVTRIVVVILGAHLLLTIPILVHLNIDEMTFKHILAIQYFAGIGWAMFDNDYTKLREIGLDENRKPLENR